jgi:hypothetical protein
MKFYYSHWPLELQQCFWWYNRFSDHFIVCKMITILHSLFGRTVHFIHPYLPSVHMKLFLSVRHAQCVALGPAGNMFSLDNSVSQLRVVAQAVSRWLPTAAARVRVRALGQVFSEYFSFPCQSFHRVLHHHDHLGLAQ